MWLFSVYLHFFFCEGGEMRMRTQKKPPKKKKNITKPFEEIWILGDSNPLPIKITTLYSSLSERQLKKDQSKISQNNRKKFKFEIQAVNPNSNFHQKYEKKNLEIFRNEFCPLFCGRSSLYCHFFYSREIWRIDIFYFQSGWAYSSF